MKKKEARSIQTEIFEWIDTVTGRKKRLLVHPEIVRFAGDFETGVFLCQLLYWSDKGKRLDGWVYKSNREWQEELCMPRYSIIKARKKLIAMGIVEVKKRRANGAPTNHYKLNQQALIDALAKHTNGDLRPNVTKVNRKKAECWP